eukprot:GHVH01006432.1.p1 GENE.GHVH01006432.1~~GHVH01006432.1.p1  ORF type:complete len:431 (-),score=42.31 GHVH01006432.1:1146-2438(-)
MQQGGTEECKGQTGDSATVADEVAADNEYHLVGGVQSKVVISIIALRFSIEIVFGIFLKSLYKNISRNVAGNLFFEILSFFPIVLALNALNRKGYKVLPMLFGGKWTFNWSIFKVMSIPGLFFVVVIIMKQTLIRNTGGPGYTEMLTGLSLSFGAIIQYYFNGIKTGILGCMAACLCLITACIAGVIVGYDCLLLGAIAAVCNVMRSSLLKKANQKYKQPAGLNLLYTQAICLPILFALMCWNEYYYSTLGHVPTSHHGAVDRIGGFWTNLEISGLFQMYWGCIPFFQPMYFVIILVSFTTNIIVIILFDLCSPLTYFVTAQLKGIVQVTADVFYVDYILILLMNLLIFLLSGRPNYIDAASYKNRHPVGNLVILAFVIKAIAASLYITEKIIKRKKKKLASQQLGVPPSSVEIAKDEVVHDVSEQVIKD